MNEQFRGFQPTDLTKKIVRIRRAVAESDSSLSHEYLSSLMSAVTVSLMDDGLINLLQLLVTEGEPFGLTASIVAMEVLIDLTAEAQFHGRILPTSWIAMAMAFAPGALTRASGPLAYVTRLDAPFQGAA